MSKSPTFLNFSPTEQATASFFSMLTASVVPRPIALVSSCNQQGAVNLSPFSFFNAFSARPPILVFSPSRSVKDNSTKHTLDNALECPEVVVHVVSYDMVEQVSLSSTAYAKGVNEFEKAGLTPVACQQVRPPRVLEARVAFECRVKEVIALGEEGGAGNLVLAEVLLMHVHPDVLDNTKQIDPLKLDPVARLGGNWYARLSKENLFEVQKPLSVLGIGVDALPEEIRKSRVLTGNDLGMLANVEALPTKEKIEAFTCTKEGQRAVQHLKSIPQKEGRLLQARHLAAQQALAQKKVEQAWCLLLLPID